MTPTNPARTLRDTRLSICAAYHTGGPDAALAAVGAGSIRLYRLVYEGNLLWRPAFKALLQVSINLKLVKVFGKSVVRKAIYAGPNFYADLQEAA